MISNIASLLDNFGTMQQTALSKGQGNSHELGQALLHAVEALLR